MSDDDNNNNDGNDIEEHLQEVSDKLKIDINVLRDISQEEIQYLLDCCPYLQIVDTVLHFIDEEPPEVQFIDAKSGWKVFDYGDAMSSSPGEKILGFAEYKRILKQDEEDDDEGGGGKGTIWNQAFLTAAEMVAIAKEHGWRGIQIIDGHRVMKRSAWIAALSEGLPVVGFEPSSEDEKVRKRVGMSSSEIETLRHQIKPGRGRS
jgi:hypothetical protein